MNKLIVYVDGFNLYYNAVRNTPHRWLDLLALSKRLFPNDTIVAIKYFSANVSARPNDPDLPTRQQTYLRVLHTIPQLEIILGHFLVSYPMMPVKNPQQGGPKSIQVIKTEEKGSDVNIAAHLMFDACRRKFDTASLITNDSDLCEPIRLVTTEMFAKVGVVNPCCVHPSKELRKHASFFKTIRPNVLGQCQFPQMLSDAIGTFSKPASW